MTEKEIQEQNNRAEQDIITLDYAKWSFQQRRLKRSDDHNLWQQERDCVIDRQRSDNAKSRAGYLQDLEDKKRAKQRADDAKTDRQLEPQKQTLMREWLANNPDKTPEDFNKSAWLHLRQNLIEQSRAADLNAHIEAEKASGRYSL